jgi:hypothetical protein
MKEWPFMVVQKAKFIHHVYPARGPVQDKANEYVSPFVLR